MIPEKLQTFYFGRGERHCFWIPRIRPLVLLGGAGGDGGNGVTDSSSDFDGGGSVSNMRMNTLKWWELVA